MKAGSLGTALTTRVNGQWPDGSLAAGAKQHGATVHFVVPEMDSGPIIVQEAVPVLAGDNEASLAARVLAVEHRIYPLALRLVAEGRVRIAGGQCLIDGVAAPLPR